MQIGIILPLIRRRQSSKQQSGFGVQIADVVHSRDFFLDRAYRTQAGRQAYYQSTYDAALEVETYLQELEGMTFQSSIEDFLEFVPGVC